MLVRGRLEDFSYALVVDTFLDGGLAGSRDLDVVEGISNERPCLVSDLPQTAAVALDHAPIDLRASLLDQRGKSQSSSLPRAESSRNSDYRGCLFRSTHQQ